MRLLLLISALLTALTGSGVSASTAAVPAHQAAASIADVAARASATFVGQRPAAARYRIELSPPVSFVRALPKSSVPIYAGRLRV